MQLINYLVIYINSLHEETYIQHKKRHSANLFTYLRIPSEFRYVSYHKLCKADEAFKNTDKYIVGIVTFSEKKKIEKFNLVSLHLSSQLN